MYVYIQFISQLNAALSMKKKQEEKKYRIKDKSKTVHKNISHGILYLY